MILLHEVQEQVILTDGDRSQNSDYLVGDGVMVVDTGKRHEGALKALEIFNILIWMVVT